MLLGQVVPDFTAETTQGKISFHEWIEKQGTWVCFFSHPADFTPVCTTELAEVQRKFCDLQDRNVMPIALSCDDVEQHLGFIDDIKSYAGLDKFQFPIIADPKRDIATLYGMLDPVEKDKAGLPLTARAVFIIGPDKTLKLSILYPATTGRNMEELLRVVDSLQLTAYKKVATPVGWKKGDDCVVLPTVKPEEYATLYPKGVKVKTMPSGKEYLRFTPCPE